MYLSRLIPDTTSLAFRRDYADLHHMHRTVMSAFPDITDETSARAHHGVLWRLDPGRTGFILYVQSRTRPDWNHLGRNYLTRPAEIRDLSAVLEALQPARTLAFRLLANPTKRLRLIDQRAPEHKGRRDNRYPIRKPSDQITWLINCGKRYGFTIPTGSDARPDVAVTPSPRLTGYQTGKRTNKLTVDSVRYDGHLVVTDPDALANALVTGIGPAKAYGCGLLSLAPPHR
ncbi:type I-E CRISPR-associated protein Cas6/Cse3/CasE [Saccharopolyspora subtropica]|uniref:Type I-E CRISPR-associated protein Cas6/Cse3/CasE n=1 Tax=Saccharopolyspora thermophila TaxID=89367 RepID=A0A917NG69_9PSEU|nr:type I-E CRISPR-associated protein Cas6/Cse3/CasE [Saccharopolyspora subtropica]GGI97874.1 type I-E CRISPR-associated protein Cas6/Cse3/CasE [Saccharopolyspora subtropica]